MKLPLRFVSLLLLGLFLIAAVPVVAETGKPANPAKGGPVQPTMDLGLIFNATIIPLDLQAYQAGLGAKIGLEDLYIRGLLDLVANGASEAFSAKIGATVEYHLTPEPLSFYVGGLFSSGYMRQGGAFSSVSFSIGAIAGVEYFPLKFLSIFAEYALIADFTWTTDLFSSLTTFDYLVDTRMGNDSKIGIVIHLLRLMGK